MSPSNALKTPKHFERPAKTTKGHSEMGDQSGGRKVTAQSKKTVQSKKRKNQKTYKVKVTEVKPLT